MSTGATLNQDILDDICAALLNEKQSAARAVYTFALASKESWQALERQCCNTKSLCLVDFYNDNSDSRSIGNKILKFKINRLTKLMVASVTSLSIPFIISEDYGRFVSQFIQDVCEAKQLIELSTDTLSILKQITNACSASLKSIKTRCCALPTEHPRDICLENLIVEVHDVHNLKQVLERCYRTKSLTLDLFNIISCSELVSQFDKLNNPHFFALKNLSLSILDKYRLYFSSMHKIFDCCAAFPSLESFDLEVKDFKGITYPPISEIVAEFINLCEQLAYRNYKFNIHFTWHIFLDMDRLFKLMKNEFDGFDLSTDDMVFPIYSKTINLSIDKTAILKFKFQ